MKVAITTGFLTKRNMDINAGHPTKVSSFMNLLRHIYKDYFTTNLVVDLQVYSIEKLPSLFDVKCLATPFIANSYFLPGASSLIVNRYLSGEVTVHEYALASHELISMFMLRLLAELI